VKRSIIGAVTPAWLAQIHPVQAHEGEHLYERP
jgi:hypothetical protein